MSKYLVCPAMAFTFFKKNTRGSPRAPSDCVWQLFASFFHNINVCLFPDCVWQLFAAPFHERNVELYPDLCIQAVWQLFASFFLKRKVYLYLHYVPHAHAHDHAMFTSRRTTCHLIWRLIRSPTASCLILSFTI